MLIGTFLEEVVSPIPSFLVLVPAGAAAKAQHEPWAYLLLLMMFSAVGRIMGSTILYTVGKRIEGAVLTKRRRLFGVSHTDIERLSERLGKRSARDWAVLFTLNAIPIFPTPTLSLICGFLNVPFRMFLFCSFFGTMINALIFMSIGYGGVQALAALQGIQFAGQITSVVCIALVLGWLIYFRRRRGSAPRHD